MKPAKTIQTLFHTLQSQANLFSYLLMIVLMASFSITLVQFASWLGAGNLSISWAILPVLAIVISIEAIFTRTISSRLEGREKWIYHLAEFVTLVVIVKLAGYFDGGFKQLLNDLSLWQQDFFNFFDVDTFLQLLVLMAIWTFMRLSSNELEDLDVSPADLQWDLGIVTNQRSASRQKLVSRFLWIGMVMVILVAGIRSGLVSNRAPNGSSFAIVNVMVYFSLALVLFSSTQYAILRGRWFWHQTPVAAWLSHRWLRYSLAFFLFLAVMSILLPTQYSMGLLDTLNSTFAVLVALVINIVQLLLLPILWLFSFLGRSKTQPNEPPPPAVPPSLPAPPVGSPTATWLELLQSILFWGILLTVVGAALLQFARQNQGFIGFVQGLFKKLSVGSVYQWLLSMLARIKHTGDRIVKGIHFPSIFQTAQFDRFSRDPLINFRRLNPRQQVIDYYLRIVEKLGREGFARKQHQTPTQWSRMIEPRLPEIKEDLHDITGAFLEARFSHHPIHEEDSTNAQRLWRNIMRAVDRERKKE